MNRRFSITIAFVCFVVVLASHANAATQISWLSASEIELSKLVPKDCVSSIVKVRQGFMSAAGPLNKKPFDFDYALELLKKDTLCEKAFELLDEAMKREKLLDESWKAAAGLECLRRSPDVKSSMDSDYYFLKSRFRLLISLARTAAAKRMALYAGRAYTSQAMESAVDAARDAALYGDKSKEYSKELGNRNPSPEKIRSLRSRLLEIWDTSQKSAGVRPIAEMNLLIVVNESLGTGDIAKQENSKRCKELSSSSQSF